MVIQQHPYNLIISIVYQTIMLPDDIRSIIEKHPNLSTIQIFKANKEGKFLGQNNFMHMVQAQFKCKNGFCYPEKNRFWGGTEMVEISFR